MLAVPPKLLPIQLEVVGNVGVEVGFPAPCAKAVVASVQRVRICVCPRVKSAEPCARGATVTSVEIERISSVPRPSGRRLSTAIFLRTRSL